MTNSSVALLADWDSGSGDHKMPNRTTRSFKRFCSLAALTAVLALGVACTMGGAAAKAKTQTNPVAGGAAQPNPSLEDVVTGDSAELSIEQAIATLKERGYSDITDIGREGDRYCVEARDPTGKRVETFVDVETGEIVYEKSRDANGATSDLSKDEVVARLKAQGYPEVSKIEREGDRYWVIARDKAGKKFELHVSAKTGEVLRKEREE